MFNLPNESDRIAIVGATGTGKTQAGVWHLSMQDYESQPWIVYNWKNDALIDGIPYAQELDVHRVPLKPGIWIVHPLPHQTLEVEAQMWEIWKRGNMGIFVDEGYMIGNSNAGFRAILTQGRSKNIPAIVLSQRPVRMDVFVFSEAQFYQVFRLQHKRDVKNVQEFVPGDLSRKLPAYHSYYYEVGTDAPIVLKPVPSASVLYRTFDTRLRPLRRVM